MVLAILYCRLHNIDFNIYSADANFRIKKGWQDYFTPFCHESLNAVHHYINRRFEAPTGGKRKILLEVYRRIFPDTFLTSDLWDSFRHIDHTELSTPEVQRLSADIIREIYHFNTTTQRHIDNAVAALRLEGPYVGFHIRGGDKKSEHELLPIDKYILTAEARTDVRQAFVYTDDYSIYEALCSRYPRWTFHTLTPRDDHGYFHLQFLKLTPEERREKLLTMFASMELLSRADLAFCTYSSNIGMFLGMRIGERAVGVDMDNWMIW